MGIAGLKGALPQILKPQPLNRNPQAQENPEPELQIPHPETLNWNPVARKGKKTEEAPEMGGRKKSKSYDDLQQAHLEREPMGYLP